jgi:sulfoquinovosidase
MLEMSGPRRAVRTAAELIALAGGGLLILTAGFPASAGARVSRAAVDLGPRQIVVTAPSGARAIVDRAPFGLAFIDSGGRTVLREVPAPGGPVGAAPTPIPPTSQSEFGTIGPPPPTVYAPLSFLVGRQAVTQTPAGQWEGTLGSVTESGLEYSAESVLTAQPSGERVVLTVSTNDPTGRRLVVTIAPSARDRFSVSVRPTPASGVATMSDSFASSSAEAFHGFGGRHNSLDQHGSEFYNWLNQENVSSGSDSGPTTTASPGQDRYMFPNGPEAAYYVQSSFVSSNGYGFLLDRPEISHWRMGSDTPGAWQVEAGAPALDYDVVAASPAQAIPGLTAVTGRQPIPPSWATGSILDREVKYPSDPASSYQQEVQSDLDNIDRYHLHLDAYRIEGWQELPKPILARDVAELKRRGIHPLLYFRAFVGRDTTGTDDPSQYTEALAKGYVSTHADGRPYTFISNFNAQAAVIDFTNPAAVRWWEQRISAALDLGADGFMQDFGEQVLTGMHFHNGMTGTQMHNLLPILYDRATRDAINLYERSHPGRRIFFFTRAGYSGTPGNAAYENANFPGDETTDWTRSSGLASQTTDMLSRAIGGAYGFSTDIGGYFDLGPYQPTTKELFLRWAEWAALSPSFRLHGSLLAGTHTPWSYDPQTVQVYKQLTALHLHAQPLIRKLWRVADQTGIPITRPLWLAYPSDAQAAQQDQEWLLGPDVLVAPIVTQGATSRAVYFPTGCWQRPDTAARYTGPASQVVPAAQDQLPYFFHCGTQPFSPPAPAGPCSPRGPNGACGTTKACPKPTGRLNSSKLGPVHLGQTRRTARRILGHYTTRHRRYMDFFCRAGNGIRAGYPSNKLLRTLTPKHARQVRGRVVLLLTANHHYALNGIRPGTHLRAVERRVRRAHRYRVGRNVWYLLPGRTSTGILKAGRGTVEEVGTADRGLTATPASARRFLTSFG